MHVGLPDEEVNICDVLVPVLAFCRASRSRSPRSGERTSSCHIIVGLLNELTSLLNHDDTVIDQVAQLDYLFWFDHLQFFS